MRDRITGEPLNGAVVTLADVDRRVVTDEGGIYAFLDVSPGPHHLGVEMSGFEARTLHALVPRGGRVEVNIALRPDPIRLAALAVEPELATRWVESPDAFQGGSRSMSAAAVRNHPLLSETDVFRALGGSDVSNDPETPTGLHIQGGAADQTGYELDGIPILAPYHTAGLFSSWNVDALSEIGLSSTSSASSTLSGVVMGFTKRPSTTLRGRSGVSSTQARVTLDGPIGNSEYGYVASIRSGFPGDALRKSDPNYLGNETGDLTAKIEGPLMGGRLSALVYRSENEINFAVRPLPDAATFDAAPRRRFEWSGDSHGASWTKSIQSSTLIISGWQARSGASGQWSDGESPTSAQSRRADRGLMAVIETRFAGDLLRLGVRGENRVTDFAHAVAGHPAALDLNSNENQTTVFAERRQPLGAGLFVHGRVAVTEALGSTFSAPLMSLEWTPLSTVIIEAEVSRRHQFTQSLRNNESIVGTILPADFAVGADAARIPVAHSDQAQITGTYRPVAGARLRGIAYRRSLRDVALVAISNQDPFATESIATGQGSVRGFGLDGAFRGTRYSAIAGYGWQNVRYEAGQTAYTPGHGVTHRAQGGVTFFPTSTLSVRLGLTGRWGRTATGFEGEFDWEACNVLDLGCEFGGTPKLSTQALGDTRLPAYVRADLGVRKHWHLEMGAVDGTLGIYGTVTNLFNRTNVLNYGRDPLSGALDPISMLPRAPLVVGLDWQF